MALTDDFGSRKTDLPYMKIIILISTFHFIKNFLKPFDIN